MAINSLPLDLGASGDPTCLYGSLYARWSSSNQTMCASWMSHLPNAASEVFHLKRASSSYTDSSWGHSEEAGLKTT